MENLMKLTTYERVSTNVSSTYKLIMLSDVHNKPFDDIIAQVAGERPDAILVGDSPTDMRTAANGGIDSIAVSWGYRTVAELSGNRIVHSVKELRAALLPGDQNN